MRAYFSALGATSPPMEIDFDNDILTWSDLTISRLGYQPSGEGKAASRLAQVFSILRNRIPPIPREVRIAENFICPQIHDAGFNQIVSEIMNGTDLMRRCSRKQSNQSGYYDRMLLDWGIYHLHLGTVEITQGRNRSLIQGHKEILFVFITNEVAYIIGIFDHSSWERLQVMKIVHSNWPHLLEPWKLRGVIDLAREVSDDDRRTLRGANINSPFKIEDTVYFGPGGGLTGAGTGANETNKALIVMRAADNLGRWIKENKDFIEQKIDMRLGRIVFDVGRFILSRTYSVYDPQNRIRIYLPSEEPAGSLVHPAQASLIDPTGEMYSYHEPGSFVDILIESVEDT